MRLARLALTLVALAAAGMAAGSCAHRESDLEQVTRLAMRQVQSNASVAGYLGTPVTVRGDADGQILVDETGWHEARLTIPVGGPNAEGVVKLIGDRHSGVWTFSTLDVLVASQRKRVDVVGRRVVEHDPAAYLTAHRKPPVTPEFERTDVPPARWSGEFPCIAVTAAPDSAPEIGTCIPALPVAALATGPLDRFEVDLRFGRFILRQTDLLLKDGALDVPLTRTYTSQFWFHRSKVHAFGRNSTHDFDVAPVGSRNPYLDSMILLPDGDMVYFPRISKGRGYADAVYQHSETSSIFYKAIKRWDGRGWEVTLDDGAMLHFPESYNAKNMAQGAPTVLVDGSGHRVELVRDPQRNLRAVRTPHGRWMKLVHDERGRVVHAEDDERHAVDYRYGAGDLLAEVRFSDGRARRYQYADALLTEVRDEAGRILVENGYRDGRVVRQSFANGETYRMHYVLAKNGHYASEATVVVPGASVHSFPTEDFVAQTIKDMP